jgi:hypothetical protein
MSVFLPPPVDPAVDKVGRFTELWYRAFRQIIAVITASPWRTVFKTADQAKASDATLGDDDALSFGVLANAKYAFRAVVFYSTAATPDFKYTLTGPSSPTLVRFHAREIEFGVARTDNEQTSFGNSRSVASGAATEGKIEIEGILHNGANAGAVTFQWAQATSNASATTVRAGSFIEYAQVQ